MFNETEFAAFTLSFLAKALSTKEKPLTEDNLKELFAADNGQTEIQNLFGTKRKEFKSEGYKEAEGKIQKTVNKSAKDLFGIDTQATTIDEAITAIKDGYEPKADETAKPAELTEKAVKQHPLYLQMEMAKTNAEKALETRNADFTKEVEAQVSGKVTTLSLQQQAMNALTDLKAKIPTHTGQKEALMNSYRHLFENVVPQTVDGKTYYYDREGNRLEDNIGTPLSWDALSRQMAEKVFELEVPDRESPGAKPAGTPGSNPGSAVGLTPKTMEELNKVLTTPGIKLEDKTAAQTYYKNNGTDL